jgi:hypothetical protein
MANRLSVRWTAVGVAVLIVVLGTFVLGSMQTAAQEPIAEEGQTLVYLAKRFGVPVMRASIRIERGPSEPGRRLVQVVAQVDSLGYLGFLCRMHNRFTSVMDAETCLPVRYIKEIDQEGLLVQKKRYVQKISFDEAGRKIVIEKTGEKERQELAIPSATYDPLSMFARCYLREDLQVGRDLRMSIHDGFRLRELIFRSKRDRIHSKMFGELDAQCLESTTSFSTFGEKSGNIRIWYTLEGKKLPVSMELDLPVGDIRFDLEKIEKS